MKFNYKPLPIEFNTNSHRYKLEGIPMIGTTTVLGMRNKAFLMFWTVKEMYKYLTKNWDIKKTYTKKEKDELLLLGKKAWTVKKDVALDSGKICHILIQKSIEENKRWKSENLNYDNEQVQKEVRSSYQAFLDWEKTCKIKYLETELIVGSKTHYVGGTIDCIAEVDGQLEAIDWKTSSRISDDSFLQLASYKMMLLEGGVDEKIRRRVVRFSKIGEGFEEISIKSNYIEDRDTFLALLKTYRWNRDTKKNFTNRQGKLRTSTKKES